MRSLDFQREENYKEYLRLLHNDDYYDVTFDENSGGMSAVHKLHKFGKQQGVAGLRRGDYERLAMAVLRKEGHRVVLGEETNLPGVKSFDGFLNDVPMEIKAIEGNGLWAIFTKLRQADKQGANCIVLYFTSKDCFSSFRIEEGIRLFHSGLDPDKPQTLLRMIVIVADSLEMDRVI